MKLLKKTHVCLLICGSFCPLPIKNCGSQYQSLVKRKGTIYSEVIQVENKGGISLLNLILYINKETPTNIQSCPPPFAKPGQLGVPYRRKRNVCSSAILLFLIQNCIFMVGRGILLHPFKPQGQERAPPGCYNLLSCFLATWFRELPLHSQSYGKAPVWLPCLGFKSWRGISSITPFPTPLTLGYTCQLQGTFPCGEGNVAQPLVWKTDEEQGQHTGPTPTERFFHGESGLHCT